jgi:hypothetical protein
MLVCFLVFYRPMGKHLALLSSRFKSFGEAPQLTQKCGTHQGDSPVSPERVSRVEPENAVALASGHDDAEGFVQKIALLKNELAAGH